MDTTFLLFIGLLFAAVMLLVWGVAAAWSAHRNPETERIARRLRAVIGGDVRESDVTIVKERRLSENPELDALLRRLPGVRKLDRMLLQAGARYLVASLLARCAACFVPGMLAAIVLRAPALALLPCGLASATLPLLLVSRARAGQDDALRAPVARSAGHDGARHARRPRLSDRAEAGRRRSVGAAGRGIQDRLRRSQFRGVDG
jgi:tight adherence protein B